MCHVSEPQAPWGTATKTSFQGYCYEVISSDSFLSLRMGLSCKSHTEAKHWLASLSHCLGHSHPAAPQTLNMSRAGLGGGTEGPESCQRPGLWRKRLTGEMLGAAQATEGEAGRTCSSHVAFWSQGEESDLLRSAKADAASGAVCGPTVHTSLSLRGFLRSTPQNPHLSATITLLWLPNVPSLLCPNHPVSSQEERGRK